MNDYCREDNNTFCYFHPKEEFIGVCPFCLTEKLAILASKQSHKKPPIRNLPKIFAFGSFLNRLEFRHRKHADGGDSDQEEASTSQEDSFISIKIEDNGAASWEKDTVSKVSLDRCNMSKETKPKEIKSIIEHSKPRNSLRWRKRIGHLLELIRWKRSTKVKACRMGTKVDGIKVRKNWLRTLSRRRTRE